MFLPPSRSVLQEHLGYERYVLDRCVDMVQAAYGTVSTAEVVVNDTPPHQVAIHVEDTFGAGMAMEIVQDASPLLFSASFKLLDMAIEWIIVENRGQCPWQFVQKRNIVNGHPPLQYPDYLGTDNRLRNVLVALYNRLASHRNALTHGQWGTNHTGDLRFDFTAHNVHVQETFTFRQVLDLAAFAALIGDTLVEPRLQTAPRLNTLRWLTDRIGPLHHLASINAGMPHHCKVRRVTTWNAATPVEVNLAGVRKILSDMHPGKTVSFDLAVHATTPNGTVDWSIPAEAIPAGDTLVLDNSCNQYKAVVPALPSGLPPGVQGVVPPQPAAGPVPAWVSSEARPRSRMGAIVLVGLGVVIGLLLRFLFG